MYEEPIQTEPRPIQQEAEGDKLPSAKVMIIAGATLFILALFFRFAFPQKVAETPPPEPIVVQPAGGNSTNWIDKLLEKPEKPEKPETPPHPRRDAVPQKTQILIPRNEAQTNCTINGGGLGCFETDYLPCVEFGVDGCLKRESPEQSANPIARAKPAGDRRWCRRVFNGTCWEQ